jgi:ribosome biogenesis protein Tsr3
MTTPHDRVVLHAARVWVTGWPHQAWEIMQAAGIGDEFPQLNRELQLRARKRFQRKMARYRVRRTTTVH